MSGNISDHAFNNRIDSTSIYRGIKLVEYVTLHKMLERTFAQSPDREAVNRLVQMSSNIALSFLRVQYKRGALDDFRFGISTEDLALDCIADAFYRDESGHFTTLETYFNSMQWRELSEEDLHIAFRRIIFSKVNEGLFRSYRTEDPNLAKIIRNIKEAIKRSSSLHLHRERETQWIIVGAEDTKKTNLPLAPSAVLESYLMSVLCQTSNTYAAVYAFEHFLKLHPYYGNAFPLSEYARVLRSCFTNRQVHDHATQEISTSLIDLENALAKTISFVQTHLHKTYVQTGKVSTSLFDTYIKAVQKTLAAHFGYPGVRIESQYEALASVLPGLSKDAFKHEHRNIMQYLFKVSRKHMLSYLTESP